MSKKGATLLGLACLTALAATNTQGALLMEEGFNYQVGTALSANAPWSGSAGSAIAIATSNLSFTTLRDAVPSGNLLRVGAGAGGNVARAFSAPVTTGPVYCAMLLNVGAGPSGTHLAAALLPSGSATPSAPDDPLDFFIRGVTGGVALAVGHTGVDLAGSSTVLAPNTTHLIVLKYAFGFSQASLYIDPTPGNAEPAFPNVRTERSDDDGNVDPPNLQTLLLSAASAGQGTYSIDTIRVGTTWADVTPVGIPVTTTGPLDQAICAGSAATFTVTAGGTAPFTYQWRTNGVAISNATNTAYTLTAPSAVDASRAYDVVVKGAFGAATSQVATLTISHIAPQILSQPANQVLWPGNSNATFTVAVAGDAPLSLQWRTNSVPIAGATNASYTVASATLADASNVFDVVAGNPCGSVTSATAAIQFAHVFLPSEGLPGFFGGMNLITTNAAGQALFVWSSPDPSVPVSGWYLEGQLAEQPLNDGTGNSIYSINVNPLSPTVYYVIGASVSGPYVSPAPAQWIITDNSGNSSFSLGTYAITQAGILVLPGTPPPLLAQPASGAVQLNGLAVPGATVLVQAASSLQPPVQWVTLATLTAGGDGSVLFSDPILQSNKWRFYRLVSP